MSSQKLYRQLARKGVDANKLAGKVVDNPEMLPEVFDGSASEIARVRYGCAKLLRIVSDREPRVLYPEMDFFIELLDSESRIMQWEAIYVIANLASVDDDKRIEKIFDRYFAPISGPVLITAANVVRGGAKIAVAKPTLTERIAREILKVDKARYQTAECRRIALGHAIEAFDRFYDGIKNKRPVIGLVKRQLRSPRNATKKKAQRFLKRHGLN
jgi:hypothetical protein